MDLFAQRRKDKDGTAAPAAASSAAAPSSSTVSLSSAATGGGVPEPPAVPPKKDAPRPPMVAKDKGTAGFAASSSYAARRPSKEAASTAAAKPASSTAAAAAAAKKPSVAKKASAASASSKRPSADTKGKDKGKRSSSSRDSKDKDKEKEKDKDKEKKRAKKETSVARDGSHDGPLSSVFRGVTFVLSGFVNPERSEVWCQRGGRVGVIRDVMRSELPFFFFWERDRRSATRRSKWARVMSLDGAAAAATSFRPLRARPKLPRPGGPAARLSPSTGFCNPIAARSACPRSGALWVDWWTVACGEKRTVPSQVPRA